AVTVNVNESVRVLTGVPEITRGMKERIGRNFVLVQGIVKSINDEILPAIATISQEFSHVNAELKQLHQGSQSLDGIDQELGKCLKTIQS
ncbi:MAG: hypothetical protein EA373_00210, partial [Oceanospirillales bacterium]